MARTRRTILCTCCAQPGPMSGRGLRMQCYTRWHRLGQLEQFPTMRFSPAEHLRRLRAQHGPDICWLWPVDALNGGGYGPHRSIWMVEHGPVPDGLELDHTCRVRACVNPGHLEAVTRRVNLERGDTFVRRNLSRTHCPQGHPYDAANTYRRAKGRDCLRCRRTRSAGRNRAVSLGIPYADPFRTVAMEGAR